MSFFAKLFRGATPRDRWNQAERLARDGEFGLARVEIQGALANGLAGEDAGHAHRQLAEWSDHLARVRLDEARAQFEADDRDAAVKAHEIAWSVVSSESLKAEIAAFGLVLGQHGTKRRVPLPVTPTAIEEPEELVGDDDIEYAGDDRLEPLDEVLLTFPPEEADVLGDLCDDDPALVTALIGRMSEPSVHATWTRIGSAAAGEPLVRREHARSLLVAGEFARARAMLEEVYAARGADAEARDLLMEARLLAKDPNAAAELARAQLGDGTVRNFTQTLSVLVEAGHAREARLAVDEKLRDAAENADLWELRGTLSGLLAEPNAVAEADVRALRAYRAQCMSCGTQPPRYPLGSARRHAELKLKGEIGGRADRGELVDLLQTLASLDHEHEERWRGELERVIG